MEDTKAKTTKRLTESDINSRLVGKGLELVSGTFKNIRSIAQWRCLEDPLHGEFSAVVKQIVHANGKCPRCGKVSKLSEEFITSELRNRPIKIVTGSLVGSDIKAKWLCLNNSEHGIWEATPSSILNKKSGCPICAGKLPLTEYEIKKRLTNRSYTIVDGSYNPKRKTATWVCLEAQNHPNWTTGVKSVLYQNTGCPECVGNAKLTEEKVLERLLGRPIHLIRGTLSGSRRRARWKCLNNDSHPSWGATPDSVLGGSGCPACTGHERINNEVIKRKMVGRDVVLVSMQVSSSSEKAIWGCTRNDKHRNWSASVSSVLAGAGCPECAGNARLNEVIINTRLIDRQICIVEGTFLSTSRHAQWSCLKEASHPDWTANVSSVLGGVGCPNCAEYGFKEDKPAFIYIMIIGDIVNPVAIKCGITNNDPELRRGQINRRSEIPVVLLHSWKHNSGRLIRMIEKRVIQMFDHNNLGGLLKDGSTETFHVVDLEKIVEVIKNGISEDLG